MTSMLERVARAIQGKLDNEFAERGGLAAEEMADIAARAAIEAMREPTADMVAAWMNEVRPGNDGRKFEDIFVERFWPAAIDAALNEEGQG